MVFSLVGGDDSPVVWYPLTTVAEKCNGMWEKNHALVFVRPRARVCSLPDRAGSPQLKAQLGRSVAGSASGDRSSDRRRSLDRARLHTRPIPWARPPVASMPRDIRMPSTDRRLAGERRCADPRRARIRRIDHARDRAQGPSG